MTRVLLSCSLLIILSGLPAISWAAAQDTIPKGVIVSKNDAKQTVTIRNQATGNRHTYFLSEKTRITSTGNKVEFNDIQPGQAVSLNFLRTDIGRELHLMRIPELDEVVEQNFADSEETLYVSGVVTGVRPVKRTITVHGPKLTQRLTLHVPKTVGIQYSGKPVKLKSISKGDEIEFQYLDTPQGYLITSGALSKKSPKKSSKEVPKQ